MRAFVSFAGQVGAIVAGAAVVAVCVLVPARAENRLLELQRNKLAADCAASEKLVERNALFLTSLTREPDLQARLALRQLGRAPDGAASEGGAAGPLDLTTPKRVEFAAPEPPIVGEAWLAGHPRVRHWLTGAGLFAVACGVVLGGGPARTSPSEPA